MKASATCAGTSCLRATPSFCVLKRTSGVRLGAGVDLFRPLFPFATQAEFWPPPEEPLLLAEAKTPFAIWRIARASLQ